MYFKYNSPIKVSVRRIDIRKKWIVLLIGCLLLGSICVIKISWKPNLDQSVIIIREAYQKLELDSLNSTVYEYPIVPGMPEWEELHSSEKMYAATNIPDEILEKMNTDALIESILTHPLLFSSFIASADSEGKQGLERFSLSCTAVWELYKRKDAGVLLAYRLIETPINHYENNVLRFFLEKGEIQKYLSGKVQKAVQVYIRETQKL